MSFSAQAQNGETFDLVFVDGLHRREQVVRDVENAARCLNPGGCIVLHDCLSTEREQQLPEPVRPEHVRNAVEGNASRRATDLVRL